MVRARPDVNAEHGLAASAKCIKAVGAEADTHLIHVLGPEAAVALAAGGEALLVVNLLNPDFGVSG